MGLIQRPSKTGGNRTYAAEIAAGYRTAKGSEVDGDVDTIYTEFNGLITNVNVSGTAGIVYTKLNLTGGVVNADVNASANIAGSKLANTSVAVGKLAVGASVNNAVVGGVTSQVLANGVETTIAQAASITTRGGSVLLLGNTSMLWSGTTTTAITFRVYRDAVVLSTTGYAIANTNAGTISVAVPCPQWVDISPAAAAHVYKLTATNTTGVFNVPANTGGFFAVELA